MYDIYIYIYTQHISQHNYNIHRCKHTSLDDDDSYQDKLLHQISQN